MKLIFCCKFSLCFFRIKITACMVVQAVVKANSQSYGNSQISIPCGSKTPNGFRWYLEYITTVCRWFHHIHVGWLVGWLEFNILFSTNTAIYQRRTKSMWRCNNMGGLSKQVTCQIFWFLSCTFFFLSFLWSPYAIGQTIIFMVALCNRADHNIFIL